jgi:hypothetical protein
MSDFYNYSKNWEQDLKIIFAFVKMYLRASGLFLYFYLFKYLLKSIYKHIYGLCYFSVQFYSINKISVSVFFRLLRAIFFPNYSFFFILPNHYFIFSRVPFLVFKSLNLPSLLYAVRIILLYIEICKIQLLEIMKDHIYLIIYVRRLFQDQKLYSTRCLLGQLGPPFHFFFFFSFFLIE